MINIWEIGIKVLLVLWLWTIVLLSLIKLCKLFIKLKKHKTKINYNTKKIYSWIIIWVISQFFSGLIFITFINPIFQITIFLITATLLNWVLFQVYKSKFTINAYEGHLVYIYLYFPVVIKVLEMSTLDEGTLPKSNPSH